MNLGQGVAELSTVAVEFQGLQVQIQVHGAQSRDEFPAPPDLKAFPEGGLYGLLLATRPESPLGLSE